jgi:hypothetical protein
MTAATGLEAAANQLRRQTLDARDNILKACAPKLWSKLHAVAEADQMVLFDHVVNCCAGRSTTGRLSNIMQ